MHSSHTYATRSQLTLLAPFAILTDLLIGNEWRPAESGRRFDVINPIERQGSHLRGRLWRCRGITAIDAAGESGRGLGGDKLASRCSRRSFMETHGAGSPATQSHASIQRRRGEECCSGLPRGPSSSVAISPIGISDGGGLSRSGRQDVGQP
jgi:hypothetical protein